MRRDIKKFCKRTIIKMFSPRDIADMLNIIDTDMETVALSLNKSIKMLGRRNSCKGQWVYMYWNRQSCVYVFIAKRNYYLDHWTARFKGAPEMTHGQAIERLRSYFLEGKIKLEKFI